MDEYKALKVSAPEPVVLTSAKPIGSRDRGDWGGLVLCGKAVNNQGTDIQMEGFNNVALDNTLAKHGGINDDDNSGSINNLRIEFGGVAFEPNKEINIDYWALHFDKFRCYDFDIFCTSAIPFIVI